MAAILEFMGLGPFSSIAAAAAYVNCLADSVLIAISASIFCTIWCWLMGTLNCTRRLA